ncbi:outer membrane efflux protein [Gemmatirosa kalamazoonensis]|uniref:Outer membrane efflux protein n=1 Tax=Gemmatirosa kalamazoonensis TaxID=861299 RepID=W0RFT5_9BACT|nr:TolC family protein [Gemmatirosa kalamazoonensis]AHG89974.1 outer membrane efflux protein [Gemmatirosa kalamazoonensis]
MTTISRFLALSAAALVAGRAASPASLAAQTPTTPHDTMLTLGQAARLAARQSAAVLAARERSREAAARVTQARSALLPDLSANASRTGRTFNTATFGIDFPAPPGQPPLFDPNGQVEGPVNLWDVRGRVAANLLDLGALGRVRAAQSAQRATGAEAENQGDLAATQAASAYLRALRAEGQYRARAADSALALDLLGIAQEQLRAGTGVALDVTRAQSQIAQSQAALITARADRDRAQLDLRRALNLSLDTPIRLADSLGTLPANESLPNETDAVQRALANRPDLRAAAAQVEAARRQTSAIKAERLPTVSAFVDQGNIGKDLNHMLPTYDYGVQVSLPIFDGFRREGRVEEQQAVANEAELRRRDLEAQAAVEVRGALLDLRAAREQVAATAERVRLAEQELSQARERFRAGVAGNADVITASLSLNAARTASVDALTAYQTARVSLARAQGSLTELP